MSRSTRNKSLLILAIGVLLVAIGAVVTHEPSSLGKQTMTPSDVDLTALDRVPPSVWRSVSQQRILFGHQSVGSNILAGVHDILQRKPDIALVINDLPESASLDQPALAHRAIGRNEDPLSKFDAFAEMLANGLGSQADIALMKICYVDIDDQTNAERLASDYLARMTSLQREHPNVTFLFATAPLTTVESGIKTRVKRLLGKPLWGYEENARRERFNAIVRKHCADSAAPAALFDLARIEATTPDGQSTWARSGGANVPCLAACYTNDGGHLNETGRLIAAREFLLQLARIVESRSN